MLFKKLLGGWWNYVYISDGIGKSVLKETKKLILAVVLTFNFLLSTFQGTAQDVTIKIHIRGVAESKITVLPLRTFPKFETLEKFIVNGETVNISIPANQLPGEFVLRFDYKEKQNSSPYPCEKHVFISNQNIELWVNPKYCNNNDSTYFQKEEKENTLFARFTKENVKQKEMLGILLNFLMNYDDTDSKFYQQGIEEYEKKRSEYNQWLKEQATLHKTMFVSHVFQFEYVPQIAFKGSEAEKTQSALSHYFDATDFQDTLLLHTKELKSFITAYVNTYASLAKTQADLDSLYPLIGKTAIEKARKGHPLVYGWMVDYFFSGYESTNMPAGIKMLEPYLNDTNCLTNKRLAIEKRLKGIKTLTIGTSAPDFSLKGDDGKDVLFSKYKTNSRYKLLLFWSADCGHCKELVAYQKVF